MSASASSSIVGDLREPAVEVRDRFGEPIARLGSVLGVEDGRISAASRPCWSRRAWPRQSRRKWTVQRCQAQPRTFAIAAFSPACTSEIASWTPTSPRATNDRRKSVQNASVSASPTSMPRISRRPLSWTPWAITSALVTTRPPSRTFSTFASRNRYG